MEIRMPQPTTEKLLKGDAIDARAPSDAAAFLLDGQQAALSSVRHVTSEITEGATLMAAAIRAKKKIHYVAAGSSGLMALADACELPGTFGIPAQAIRIHMAGGIPSDGHMPGNTEDDLSACDSVSEKILNGDTVIVLTASGTTPYALEIATGAKSKGAKVIGIANNPATPVLDLANVSICLRTPPEVVAGSTRLGAGTAQKAALNLMSTQMGIELGHVYQGLMVNVVADNTKLVARAAGIVAQIAGVSNAEAEAALAQVDGNTKMAILVAAGCIPTQAQQLLESCNGQLGRCFHRINTSQNEKI